MFHPYTGGCTLRSAPSQAPQSRSFSFSYIIKIIGSRKCTCTFVFATSQYQTPCRNRSAHRDDRAFDFTAYLKLPPLKSRSSFPFLLLVPSAKMMKFFPSITSFVTCKITFMPCRGIPAVNRKRTEAGDHLFQKRNILQFLFEHHRRRRFSSWSIASTSNIP